MNLLWSIHHNWNTNTNSTNLKNHTHDKYNSFDKTLLISVLLTRRNVNYKKYLLFEIDEALITLIFSWEIIKILGWHFCHPHVLACCKLLYNTSKLDLINYHTHTFKSTDILKYESFWYWRKMSRILFFNIAYFKTIVIKRV